MRGKFFIHSLIVMAKKDVFAHFRSLSNNLLLFLYFITGAIFWATTLGQLVFLRGYFQFLIVGLMVIGVYNTSYGYVNVVSTDSRKGYLKYLLALPLSRAGIASGRVIAGAVQGAAFVTVLFAFASLMIGLPSFVGIMTVYVAIVSLSLFYSSAGIVVATYFRSDLVDPVSDILGLILIFTSTVFYPENLMPVPIRLISSISPISAGANLIRAGFGTAMVDPQRLIVLFLSNLVVGSLSIRGYYRQLKEMH